MYREKKQWYEPLIFAQYIDCLNIDYVFLFSSLQTHYSGRFSFLAYNLNSKITNLQEFEKCFNNINTRWFGYIGYETKNQLEKLPKTQESFIHMPDLYMCSFNNLVIFDHSEKSVEEFSEFPASQFEKKISNTSHIYYNNVKYLSSNMNKDEYLKNIDRTLSCIYRGDFYQANITRKFYGYLENNFKPLKIFSNLCSISPSPYSSFLKLGKYRIISSSPEMFVKISDDIVETRPIKGSAPRFKDKNQDLYSKNQLLNSKKDISENLMIVDLMRNDFSRSSIPGSVEVRDMFNVYTYSTIYHMYSTILAKKNINISNLNFIKNCFPPGSVTGSPKIQAMKWCSEIEKYDRGVYSGCIGYIDHIHADFSVVIRTLILEDNKFEFQVGGGIVAESTPLSEWEETLLKAKPIAEILGLSIEDLSF